MNRLQMLTAAVQAHPHRAADLIRAAYWLGASEGIELHRNQPSTADKSVAGMAQAYAGAIDLEAYKKE